MIKFEEFELNNGLKVLVHEDPTTPIATVNMLYNVGSKDENPNKTGFAHLFEHFMFEGSKNIKHFDDEMQKAGGNNNAFTTNDFTNYYETLPASNIETAFWLESDRMLELDFNQKSLDTQISVVSEEFKENYINKPYGDVWHKLLATAYKTHPYRWPTIGYNLEHIAQITMQETKDFFYKYYRPNNAILSVAGGVKTAEVERLAKKWFGNIPQGEKIMRQLPQEPQQTTQRHTEIVADVPVNCIYIAFHVGNRFQPNYFATDLLSDLLGVGKSSRLHLELVKKQKLFSSINTQFADFDDGGLIVIRGKMTENTLFEDAEKAIFDCINELKNNGISKRELSKVINKTASYLSFSNVSHINKSFNLAYFKMVNQLHLVNEEIQHFEAVSSEEVQMVAKKYLKESNSSVLYYKAKK